MIGKGWGAVHLLVLGLDQHTAPLAVRERLSWDISDLSALLPPLLDRGLGEVALLCTCNRTEFYAVAQDPATARQVLGEVLVSRSGLGAEFQDRHAAAGAHNPPHLRQGPVQIRDVAHHEC